MKAFPIDYGIFFQSSVVHSNFMISDSPQIPSPCIVELKKLSYAMSQQLRGYLSETKEREFKAY